MHPIKIYDIFTIYSTILLIHCILSRFDKKIIYCIFFKLKGNEVLTKIVKKCKKKTCFKSILKTFTFDNI